MDKRVIIVDFNHLVHTYYNSHHRLSKTVMVNGKAQLIDTTVQNGTIKAIHRWSKGGKYPTAICFDSPVPSRKAYFSKVFDMPVEGGKAYKGGRSSMAGGMYDAIEMTMNILISAGVSCFKGNNYEADDLVFACIEKAKEDYPDHYIDVITNDADLLPLVDDRVSVFIRSKKFTWAERKDLEKAHYIQVTPRNFQEVVEDLSSYRKFSIPYNTLLLHKLLRGDGSDNISSDVKRLFPPTKYNALVSRLIEDGVDLSRLCRYGRCVERFVSVRTGEVVDSSHDRSDIAIRYEDPVELEDLIGILYWYIEDLTVLEHIRKMYRGMNLNGAFVGLGSASRRPARVRGISGYSEAVLQSKVAPLDIRLKLFL